MMKCKSSAVLAVLAAALLLILSASILHSQSAQDLYQKALSQEKAQGNLTQAIETYKKVIAGAGADRALAAKAQYHIGLCYEKLGTTEAEKAFRQVIDKYPEQKESVTAANERLAVMAKTQSAPQGSGIVLRQIAVPDGYPSPDGKFFACAISHDSRKPGVKWDYDDLKLYEVATGKEKLIADLNSFESSTISAINWSPSGKRIAFVVFQGLSPSSTDKLCIVGSDGSNFKVIYENHGQPIYGIAGWLPDETAVVLTIGSQDGSRSIAEVSLKSAMLREITNLGKPVDPTLSPDGRFVAYEVRNPESQKFDIRMIAMDGSSDGYIVQHPANGTLLGWTPDSRYMLFKSDRSGVPAIWLQEIGGGKPIGSPALIIERAVYPLGVIQNGNFYFTENEIRSDVSVAQVDLTTGKTLRPPESIDPFYSGNKYSPVWSRDGGQLAYFIGKGNNNPAPSLRIHPMAGGKDREVTVDLSSITSAMMPVPWWNEDNFIYACGVKQVNGKVESGIYRIDIQSGHSDFVSNGYAGAFLPDGQFAVLQRRNNATSFLEGQSSLFRKDLKTGNEILIMSGEVGQSFVSVQVSPDGKWVGYSMADPRDYGKTGSYVVPTSGGRAQLILPPAEKTGMINSPVFWGPIGSILFNRFSREDGGEITKRELWYMPAFDAMKARKLDFEIPGLRTMTFHPDGKTFAFTSTVSETKVWVMENYLPAKK